jgi:hypothetical protein
VPGMNIQFLNQLKPPLREGLRKTKSNRTTDKKERQKYKNLRKCRTISLISLGIKDFLNKT